MTSLKGRRALVTGASSGLGADIARELAARGASLVLVARRVDRLEQLRDELHASHGVAVDIVALDLARPEAADALHRRLAASGIAIDVLVNNAGFGLYGPFLELPWEREQELLQLDVVTLVRLTRLFTPEMVRRGFGHVLQVASIGAYQPSPLYACYGAAKAFVRSYGEAIDYELRGSGVRCTVLSPGMTATEFLDVAGQKPTAVQRLVVMPSRTVARIAVAAMLEGRTNVVPGAINKFATLLTRFVPRRVAAAIAHATMK